ncbi:copper chaperone [Staphylococcus arlettae]|uniref:Copper chaperone CopZ n=1 Tax=Staphylococcus arlettae TaxID=29378 RepID=A0A380BZC1_9STAP|nr:MULTISPECIES: copper chaperone CopZ [Staphylococcus]EJY96845.1 copper chaperone [Staphylococcus arlettae CVD059]ERF48206.1 copper chaperone CopZ [Staphylococcus sp. EGD-HP3]KAB2478955.1 copper chaperone CopZ [Staphylococcus sp. CH99b_3]MCD8815764.1 copper chaperone CopZ [Staphylococcus arlettae]MCD8834926.1 copper chaperone CopZ [Staphylococcus arlettae]
MTTETIQVEGMSCDHCKQAVEGALTKLSGVSTAKVDLTAGNVQVDYDNDQVEVTDMKSAIEDQGYDVQ